MIQIKRTNSFNEDFKQLINELDADLLNRYPEIQNNYKTFNQLDQIDTVLVAYDDRIPVACGCFKVYNTDTVEIKRMFVRNTYRGKGISKLVLNNLINWAEELNYSKIVLETGKNQPEAISLYQKTGFVRIKNYGPYTNIENSLCFEKIIH